MILLPVPILALARLGENKSILNTTAPLQDRRILNRVIALTRHVGSTKLELRRQRRLARPLHVRVVVVGAAVGAAHDVDIVKAFCVAADACQLWDCGGAAGGSEFVLAEGEGFYVC